MEEDTIGRHRYSNERVYGRWRGDLVVKDDTVERETDRSNR